VSKEKATTKAALKLNADGVENCGGRRNRNNALSWELGQEAREKEAKHMIVRRQQGRLSDLQNAGSPQKVARLKRTHEEYIRVATPKEKRRRESVVHPTVASPTIRGAASEPVDYSEPLVVPAKKAKTTKTSDEFFSALCDSTTGSLDSHFSSAKFDCGGLHKTALAQRSLGQQISVWDCGRCTLTNFLKGEFNPMELSCKSCGWTPPSK
jgi:hypothetical protein